MLYSSAYPHIAVVILTAMSSSMPSCQCRQDVGTSVTSGQSQRQLAVTAQCQANIPGKAEYFHVTFPVTHHKFVSICIFALTLHVILMCKCLNTLSLTTVISLPVDVTYILSLPLVLQGEVVNVHIGSS